MASATAGSDRRRISRLGRRLAPILAALLAGACTPAPLIRYDLHTPSAALVPIAYAGISDERSRFREIFCAVQEDHGAQLPNDRPCDQALHRLLDEPRPAEATPVYLGPARLPLRLVIVPGLAEECLQSFIRPFSDARPHVESLGFKTDLIMVSGLGGSARNAAQIRDALAAMPAAPPEEKLVFLGYSKGATDALEAMVRHPELAERTAAVVTLAGVVSGTPIADDASELIKGLMDRVLAGSRCPPGEGRAIESLSRRERLAWLAANRLPDQVRYYSLAAFADRENISLILHSSYDTLALVDPRNDSQVVFHDALVPGGALLGYLNADHWAIALPFTQEHPALAETLITRNAFPREVLLESIARFVEESLLDESNR
jgi:hypothetical protein